MKQESIEDLGRADFILGVNKDVLKAILDQLEGHGPDPHILQMLSAALCMVVEDVEKAFPGTMDILSQLLEKRKQ